PRARSRRPVRETGAGPRATARGRPPGSRAPQRAARARSAGPASSARGPVEQVGQLDLGLARPPAQARQLDVLHAAEERLSLHDGDDAPLEVAEHLPPACPFGADRVAAGALVGGEETLAVAQAARRGCGTEAPRADAEPADVLHRVADVGELPVDYGAQPVGTDDDVADAVVAVHDRAPGRARDAGAEPAEREFERGVGMGGDGAGGACA